MRGTSRLLVWIALLSGTACDSGEGISPFDRRFPVPVVGDYALVSVGNQQLPIDQGSLPTRNGSPSLCNFLWDAGGMTLTATGFELYYEHHSSCGGPPLSRTYEAGTYARIGRDSLLLTSGYGTQHNARAYGDSLDIRFYEYDLRFRRK